MSTIEATSSTSSAVGGATGRARRERALDRRELREVEILWSDHQGHARGKRITADGFLERAEGQGWGCREEKSQIQALDRTALILPMLVDRDHGTLGRVEVQADDVAEIGVIVAAELP